MQLKARWNAGCSDWFGRKRKQSSLSFSTTLIFEGLRRACLAKRRAISNEKTVICVGTRVIRATRSVSNDLFNFRSLYGLEPRRRRFPSYFYQPPFLLFLPDFASMYLEHFFNWILTPNSSSCQIYEEFLLPKKRHNAVRNIKKLCKCSKRFIKQKIM